MASSENTLSCLKERIFKILQRDFLLMRLEICPITLRGDLGPDVNDLSDAQAARCTFGRGLPIYVR